MKCITKKCNANALTNDKHCFFHSDKISDEQKKQARSTGGKVRQIRVKSEFNNYELLTLSDIIKLNSEMINRILRNELDLRVGTGINYMLSLQMRLLEISDIEKRISLLESKIIENELLESD